MTPTVGRPALQAQATQAAAEVHARAHVQAGLIESGLPEDRLAGLRLRSGRELVEAGQRSPEEPLLPTAIPMLDDLLQGGLRRGETVELVGRWSSGRFSLTLATLAAVTSAGEAAAFVDLGDSLTPEAAVEAGVDLRRLLWVRPRSMKETLAAAEAILTCGMPLLALDLGLPPLTGGRGAEAAWLRLARGARDRRTALWIASPYRVSGTAAHRVLAANAVRSRWSRFTRRMLRGLVTGVEGLKGLRLGASGHQHLTLAADCRGVRHATAEPLAFPAAGQPTHTTAPTEGTRAIA